MPFARQIRVDVTPEPELEAKLVELWQPFAARIRRAQVTRLHGKTPTELREDVAGELEEGEDEHAFVLGIVAECIAIACADASGKKKKYGFTLFGEAPPDSSKQPTLCKMHAAFIDGSEEPVRDRETETVAAMKAATSWGTDMSKKHIELATTMNTMLEKVADMVGKLGDSLAKSGESTARLELERDKVKLELELAAADREARRASQRYAWETVKGWGTNLPSAIALLREWVAWRRAAAGGDASTPPAADAPPAEPPSDDELELLFREHAPDLVDIGKALRTATGAERSALAVKAKEIWDGIEGTTQARILFGAQSKLSKDRLAVLGAWMLSLGVGS